MKASLRPVAQQVVMSLLQAAKATSMIEIYERIRPGPDGRIRTNLSPVATITGRLGSSATFLEASTNLQNIPKKTAKLHPLYNVRTVMVPDPGCVLLEADLSQAEARATAAFANDEATLELFASGGDIHKLTAASIFGCRVEDVTPTQRQLGKMCRHALNYGMSWKGFLRAVNADADLTGVRINASEAKAVVEAYHRANPALLRWWRKIENDLRVKGYLVNPFGRKLIPLDLDDINSAIAFLPQSTVADHVNTRLRYIFEVLDPKVLQVLLQIHDAVLCQAPTARLLIAARALKRAMEAPIQVGHIELFIPADVSASATSWGELKEVKV